MSTTRTCQLIQNNPLQGHSIAEPSSVQLSERPGLPNLPSSQQNQLADNYSASQQQSDKLVTPLFCDIFERLFGSDELQLIFDKKESTFGEVYQEIWQNIKEEIERLQSIQLEFSENLRIFQTKTSKMTIEDKWKMIVINYREKLAKLETKIQEERKTRDLLEETARLQAEEKDRLGHLNNMKFKKINALLAQKEHQQSQINSLNETISNLKFELDQSKQSKSMLLIQLHDANRVKDQLISELTFVKQQSIVAERQNQLITKQLKILGQEEESVNRQIIDLKMKYEIEIAKLENTISNLTIERQEHLMLIDQLQRKTHHSFSLLEKVEAQTQTESQAIRAEYYNSLADQLDDDSFDSKEQEYQQEDPQNFSYELGRGKQEVLSEGDPESYNQFEIPLGSLSASQHVVLTDRSANPRRHFDNQLNIMNAEASIDECQSCISNTPSKYLQTMGELTASLAQAYQKINELTQKVTVLQGQKFKIENKLKEKDDKSKTKEKQQGLGYFSSFFKK